MYNASDLKKGLKIELEGVPYAITEFNFVKPGKGQAIYNCKLKNLLTGSTMARAFRDNVKIDEPRIEDRTLEYSYTEGENLVFLDRNFEQVSVSAAALGDSRYFLEDGISVTIQFFNGKPINVEFPTFIEREVVQTEPGARGDTVNNVQKPATVAGGYKLHVPIFVSQGDVIRIDTRTGEYADRVNKK
jgi:elongation factor P